MDTLNLNTDEYFSSYEDIEVHKTMLEDEVRTLAYKNAILNNKDFFNNKIVMDVGCGTGILSIFCAQAGAKKVYAIEGSNIAKLAVEIVKDNGFDEIIEVIQSKVEDLVLPDNIKVDIIVSEWMGFYLLHEGMLDSVLFARDKFLKKDGAMFPESAAIYVAPCSFPYLYDKWDNLYGVTMSHFAKCVRQSKGDKPAVLGIKPDDLLGKEVAICWIDLREVKTEDIDTFTITHVATATRSGFYHGLCVWFDCVFPELSKDENKDAVHLDTSPYGPETHWKQTIIVLPQSYEVTDGEPLAFRLEMKRDGEFRRRYNLQLDLLDPEEVEHPVPCKCHMTKCILINTIMINHAQNTLKAGGNIEEGELIIIEDDL